MDASELVKREKTSVKTGLIVSIGAAVVGVVARRPEIISIDIPVIGVTSGLIGSLARWILNGVPSVLHEPTPNLETDVVTVSDNAISASAHEPQLIQN